METRVSFFLPAFYMFPEMLDNGGEKRYQYRCNYPQEDQKIFIRHRAPF
jgi:hypothetical protein